MPYIITAIAPKAHETLALQNELKSEGIVWKDYLLPKFVIPTREVAQRIIDRLRADRRDPGWHIEEVDGTQSNTITPTR